MSSRSLCRLKRRGAGRGSLAGVDFSRRRGAWTSPCLLIECLSGGGAFIGDPRVPHGALGIVFSVLQLAEIVIDPLRGSTLTVTVFQMVQRNSDVLWLSAPVSLGPNGTECAGELLGDPPQPGIRNRQFPIGRGLRCKQLHLFSQLDGVLFIPAPPAGALEGSGDLNLYSTVLAELVVFELPYVSMGG